MTAQIVFVSLSSASRTNVGMTSAVTGTITEPRSTAKYRLRPGNRYLANP
jgi:hypothetical protein